LMTADMIVDRTAERSRLSRGLTIISRHTT
jgi:hypothetical protein